VLLEAAEETQAIARQAAAAGSIVVDCGGSRAGWDVGDVAGRLDREVGGL
jgi:hypothetical protein